MGDMITITNDEDFTSRVEVVPEDFWWFLTNLLPGTRVKICVEGGLSASIVIEGQGKREVANNA